MANQTRETYTLDRDPETDNWDDCPGGDHKLRYRGDDEHRDDYERYAFFVCDNPECRVREAVVRYRGDVDVEEDSDWDTSRL